MPNPIIVTSSTLAAGVFTITFKIAAGSGPVENFDLQFSYDTAKVASLSASGPATDWSTASSTNSPGVFSVAAFTTNEAPLADGATALTLRMTLANAADTSASVNFSGSYNAANLPVALTGVALANNTFTFNAPVQGVPTITSSTGSLTEDATLTAVTSALTDGDGLGPLSYQWLRDGSAISGATAATYKLDDPDVGRKISVRVSYTDGHSVAESVTSAQSATVVGVNDAPAGALTIAGNNAKGATLSSTSTVTDADGLGTFAYQWFADTTAIAGATASSFALTANEVGKPVKLVVTYTDLQGFSNTVTSNVTAAIVADHAPTGSVSISGTPTQNQVLTASNTLADVDGLGTISYQWFANDGTTNTAISGATASTYTIKQSDVTKTISVKASYTDALGNVNSPSSAATAAVANVNDPLQGTVTISGTAAQNQTLTASNTLTDIDGLGAVSYQWLADGSPIVGATSSTLALTQAQAGKPVAVKASYTDGFGFAESLTSAAVTVANVNDLPQGTVTVAGTNTQGQTLTASNTLTDADGPSPLFIRYQWQADGTPIGGATSSSLVLGQAQVGKAISVQASYTDAFGASESKTSTAGSLVQNINDAPAGTLTISGAATKGQVLTAVNAITDLDGIPAGGTSYQWFANDGTTNTAISGATAITYTLTPGDVGKTITVKASYTDDFKQAESVTSAPTATVIVDNLPTGNVTIAGTPTQGQTLTASNNLADADGPATLSISYQWQAGGLNIAGATGSTIVLAEAQVGQVITVKASYADALGTPSSKTSSATASVANVNDPMVGVPTITGTVKQGQLLTANTSGVSDADGLGTFSYQWFAGTAAITGASAATFTPTQSEVGKALKVTVSYTDGHGTTESASSAASVSVVNNNDSPTGTVSIAGTATQKQTLTASNTLADLDGLGTISYQWLADNVAISGATASTLVLGQAQVGKVISVKASYTDGFNQAESMTSTGTTAVVNVNDAPTGAVTISGTPTQNQTLTASNTLADIDGLGTISYQWFAGADAITGATASTYLLKEAEVGKTITVKAAYTDGFGQAESVTSGATTTVVNVNDAPTGSVTVTGTYTQGQTLTASNTLADLDGMGTVAYQWFAGTAAIAGATASTLVLGQAQVGKAVTAQARYTDGRGTVETVSSATPGASVANINDNPTGAPTIAGTATQGQVLTAGTAAIQDPDGLGAFSYQWLADNVAIGGATASTLLLTQAQVNKAITVKVSYTDGGSVAESVTSTATAAVANVNDAPTGAVAIAGAATQNQTLTASSTLADLDGLGAISYQWLADNVAISGATAGTFQLTQAQVGKAITLRANYTDGFGAAESRTSAATARVANVNDAPAGLPAIEGAAQQKVTLQASVAGISDADGLPAATTFKYQWFAGGVAIAGATSASYTLTQAEVTKAVTVKVTYTDLQGSTETVQSAATAAVTNVNDLPTGGITISGAKLAGLPLTAVSTLADIDGLGTFNYQWTVGGANVTGATAATYTPVAADAGKAIGVKVTYTDLFGTAESATGAAVTIAKEDDAPSLLTGGLAGDGNGDGILDSAQAAVVSAPFTQTGSAAPIFVTLVVDSADSGAANTGTTANIQTVSQQAAPPDLPAKFKSPLGSIDFTAKLAPGVVTETFTLFVDASLKVNGYFKKDASGTWVNLASKTYDGSVTTVGTKTKLNFKITDGSQFDDDHAVNGIIKDPGSIGNLPLSLVGYAPDLVLTDSTHFFF